MLLNFEQYLKLAILKSVWYITSKNESWICVFFIFNLFCLALLTLNSLELLTMYALLILYQCFYYQWSPDSSVGWVCFTKLTIFSCFQNFLFWWVVNKYICRCVRSISLFLPWEGTVCWWKYYLDGTMFMRRPLLGEEMPIQL